MSRGKTVCKSANEPSGSGVITSSCGMKRPRVFLLPLDGVLVHRRSIKSAGTHSSTLLARVTESKVSCPRTQHFND